jgi:hypothetical protein
MLETVDVQRIPGPLGIPSQSVAAGETLEFFFFRKAIISAFSLEIMPSILQVYKIGLYLLLGSGSCCHHVAECFSVLLAIVSR